jgi:DNA invertase Pin-like site-specific DNA recombinase
MGRVFVYRRLRLDADAEGQATAAEAFVSRLAKDERVVTYQDGPETVGVPLACRSQGAKICRSLEKNDTVIFSARDCANAADLISNIETWTASGVRCVVADIGLDTTEEGAAKILRTLSAVVDAIRDVRGERVARGLRQRQALGRPANGRIVYGYRHAGPKGNRRYVPDAKQRKIGKEILQRRLDGHTWEMIYFYLIERGERQRNGKEISLGTIRRWCIGEARIQALEACRARESQAQLDLEGGESPAARG